MTILSLKIQSQDTSNLYLTLGNITIRPLAVKEILNYNNGISIPINWKRKKISVDIGFEIKKKCFYDLNGKSIFLSDSIQIDSLFKLKIEEIKLYDSFGEIKIEKIRIHYLVNNFYIEEIGDIEFYPEGEDLKVLLFKDQELTDRLKEKGSILIIALTTNKGVYRCFPILTKPFKLELVYGLFKKSIEREELINIKECDKEPDWKVNYDNYWLND